MEQEHCETNSQPWQQSDVSVSKSLKEEPKWDKFYSWICNKKNACKTMLWFREQYHDTAAAVLHNIYVNNRKQTFEDSTTSS